MILFLKNIKNSLTISERDGNMTKFSEMRQSHVEEIQKNLKKFLTGGERHGSITKLLQARRQELTKKFKKAKKVLDKQKAVW